MSVSHMGSVRLDSSTCCRSDVPTSCRTPVDASLEDGSKGKNRGDDRENNREDDLWCHSFFLRNINRMNTSAYNLAKECVILMNVTGRC